MRGEARDWPKSSFVGRDDAGDATEPGLDLCNFFFVDAGNSLFLRFTTVAPLTNGASYSIEIRQKGARDRLDVVPELPGLRANQTRTMVEIALPRPQGFSGIQEATVRVFDADGILADELISDGEILGTTGNCAFAHHGNQGLTWTNVFRGDDETNGYDEVLEVHQNRGVPGNFHMSGTLITAAEWHDRGFNDWLRQGVNSGWVCMMGSAFGQHIMPFVQHDMNEWAVSTEDAMVYAKYSNFEAKVAWIPERVWCSQGIYPDNGIPSPWHGDSWLGDNWEQHGIEAILLDDWPHLNGYSDRKIHWVSNLAGVTLRAIPIDGDFTGNCQWNSAAAISQIMGTGQYGIVVYGTDWEAAAALSDWCTEDCLINYKAVVNWCGDNYPAVEAWRLDVALTNSDFNGDLSAAITSGTYGTIGGTDGYGGSNNSWYTNWHDEGSHSDHHTPQWTYGDVWWDAYNNLLAAPDNDLRETGWYVMMTNLHETGWHDYMGGPISGWEHRYSAHIKNANVYTEAAHWANDEYAITTNAYFSDIDRDGCNELCIHNDRVFAVFDSIGGRAIWVFAKGPGGHFSIVGNCNVYWTETEGDWDEPSSNNHQAALADVSPHYRHNTYDMYVESVTGTTAEIRMVYNDVTKYVSLTTGEAYLDCRYDVGLQNCYLRSGFSPDLLDLTWNADMERIYDPEVAYVGYRNPNTGATGLYIIGNGGANWNSGGVFTATLLGGDELVGYRQFGFLLYAGETTDPVDGEIAEIEILAAQNMDYYDPCVVSPAIFESDNQVKVRFSEAAEQTTAENISNYAFSGFATTYTIVSAVRQSDWSKVVLTVTPDFVPGESGTITVLNVEDLNGNVIASECDDASFSIPSGFTPHTIIIDGDLDFDRENEFLTSVGAESLFFTWDNDYLYVGVKDKDLSLGDLFVSLDINSGTTSGADTGCWYRVLYTGTFRPEYMVAIEGGPDNMQINHWNGSSWDYLHHGQHGGSSYNGWSGNPYTEMSIPWSDIGSPTSLALAVHLSEEDTEVTTTVWPPYGNTTGDHITIANFYRLFEPYISGPMPLMGYQPKNTPDRELPGDVLDIVIHTQGNDLILNWSPAANADAYIIYRAMTPFGTFDSLSTVTDTTYTDIGALIMDKYFYRVNSSN